MTDEEWDWLRRLGFEQSPFTRTRWTKTSESGVPGHVYASAWLDLTPVGWKLTTWPIDGGRQEHDTLGLELVPMLAFALAEGWL